MSDDRRRRSCRFTADGIEVIRIFIEDEGCIGQQLERLPESLHHDGGAISRRASEGNPCVPALQ